MCTNSGNMLHALDICDAVKHKLRIESLKAQVEIQKCEFKSTSYKFKSTSSRIMRQLVRSVSGDNFLFYVSTTPWLQLQQKAEWVYINCERRALEFFTESFGETCFSFAFKKTKCNGFFFHLFNTKRWSVHLNYYCQALQVPPHRTIVPHLIRQWLLISAPCVCLVPSLIVPPNSHIQK